MVKIASKFPKDSRLKDASRDNMLGRVYAQGFGPESALQAFLKGHPAALSGLLAVLISAVILTANYGIYAFNERKVVPQSAVKTKQISGAFANGGSVKWVAIVDTKDVKPDQRYVQVPETAVNIRIALLSEKEKDTLLKAPVPKPSVNLKERKQIALVSLAIRNSVQKPYGENDLVEIFKHLLASASKTVEKAKGGGNKEKTQQVDIVQVLLEEESPYFIAVIYETPAPAITESLTSQGEKSVY